MSDLLRVAGVTKTFGSVRALDDCTLGVAAASVTGLIGPNGSGKTTLFNIVTGYERADAGNVAYAGADVTGMGGGRLYRRGMSRTFQQARVFPQLTVLENLVVAAGYRWWQWSGPRIGRRDREAGLALLAEFGLDALAAARAATLSYGQRKLLEFAALLMSAPRLVLLDEPTAGVNPVMVATMERHVRARHAAGTTFLIVEHDLPFVMRLCDPVLVLDGGRLICAGPPERVQNDPAVLDAYLGA